MTLFTLRAHVRALTNPHGETLFVHDTRLLYRGSLAFLAAAELLLYLKNSSSQRCRELK